MAVSEGQAAVSKCQDAEAQDPDEEAADDYQRHRSADPDARTRPLDAMSWNLAGPSGAPSGAEWSANHISRVTYCRSRTKATACHCSPRF